MADALERLLRDGQQARQVQAALDAQFGPGAARIDEVIKSGRDAVVLAGVFQGQATVFKQFLRGGVAQAIPRMQEELTLLDQHLGQGTCRVNRLLAALPEDGLAVLERVPGERVSLILKSDDAARRARVLALCGDWLAAVAPLRAERKRLGGSRLERQFADLSLDGLSAEDSALAEGLMEVVRRFGKRVRGMDAVHSVAHGDFAPVNMMSDGETIWAVDIQGATRFPLARIVARFMVAKDLYSQRESVRKWGVDADDVDTLNPARLLPEQEWQTTLPFFIAQQMVRRFVSSYAERGGDPAARSRLTDCLTDLEAA